MSSLWARHQSTYVGLGGGGGKNDGMVTFFIWEGRAWLSVLAELG